MSAHEAKTRSHSSQVTTNDALQGGETAPDATSNFGSPFLSQSRERRATCPDAFPQASGPIFLSRLAANIGAALRSEKEPLA